jgi:hypothetical protein
MQVEKQIKITIDKPEEIQALSDICELARQRIAIVKDENVDRVKDKLGGEKWANFVSLPVDRARNVVELQEKIFEL